MGGCLAFFSRGVLIFRNVSVSSFLLDLALGHRGRVIISPVTGRQSLVMPPLDLRPSSKVVGILSCSARGPGEVSHRISTLRQYLNTTSGTRDSSQHCFWTPWLLVSEEGKTTGAKKWAEKIGTSKNGCC